DDLGAGEGFGFAGGEAELRDTRDAGHGFAAEAEGVDGGEVLFCADFRGGVALEAHEGVVAVHARAVVGHANEGDAAALDADLDVGGARVDAVLDEFFHDGGGALDHFTGGDLAGEGFGEKADFSHGDAEGSTEGGPG